MDNQTMKSVLQVEELNIFYGSFQAVCNVSFNVKAGEIFGLLDQMAQENKYIKRNRRIAETSVG
jgi:ABC-type uncharacterized transport system ATPase subunit